jgi:ATP-dependent exoDNAse (exonuclease V) beta subunit
MIKNVFLFEEKSFFIVGDEKQSIYDFQDSCSEYYLNFIEKLQILSEQNGKILVLENSNETYRFGGEILQLINKNYSLHRGNKSKGSVSYIEDDLDEIEYFVRFLNDKLLILYKGVNSKIIALQNRLSDYGLNIKMWLDFDKLSEALNDVLQYRITGLLWFKVKILQGPFIHLGEPHLHLLYLNNQLENYKSDWFDKLLSINEAWKVMEFLFENIHLTSIEIELFKELYKYSYNFFSFESFVFNIPQRVSIIKENELINFSTVHSAKGLEEKNVLYIPTFFKKKNIHVNLNPFFITKNPKEYFISNYNKTEENLEYVALTRAKENLFLIEEFI